MGIDYDLLKGLPKNISSWPIWLGDHYSKGNLNIPAIVCILAREFSKDLNENFSWSGQTDASYVNLAACFDKYNKVWIDFCNALNFGATNHFENEVCSVIPGFDRLLKRGRDN